MIGGTNHILLQSLRQPYISLGVVYTDNKSLTVPHYPIYPIERRRQSQIAVASSRTLRNKKTIYSILFFPCRYVGNKPQETRRGRSDQGHRAAPRRPVHREVVE